MSILTNRPLSLPNFSKIFLSSHILTILPLVKGDLTIPTYNCCPMLLVWKRYSCFEGYKFAANLLVSLIPNRSKGNLVLRKSYLDHKPVKMDEDNAFVGRYTIHDKQVNLGKSPIMVNLTSSHFGT